VTNNQENTMTAMNKYLVTIGNTEDRRGHRHDCAQVAVTFEVEAPDEKGAVDIVKSIAEAGPIQASVVGPRPTVFKGPKGAPRAGVAITLALNVSMIQVRTVEVHDDKRSAS
jgi:hypothetical protein